VTSESNILCDRVRKKDAEREAESLLILLSKRVKEGASLEKTYATMKEEIGSDNPFRKAVQNHFATLFREQTNELMKTSAAAPIPALDDIASSQS
jgi:hypothetical protein